MANGKSFEGMFAMALSATAVLLFGAACATTVQFQREQLNRLNRFRATPAIAEPVEVGHRWESDGTIHPIEVSTETEPTPVALQTTDGEVVLFDGNRELFLVLSDGERLGGQFSSIDTYDGLFRGQLQDGQTIELGLEHIECGETEVSDPGMTAATVVLVSASVVGLLVLGWSTIDLDI